MALDLPRSERPQRDSELLVELIERTEAGETFT
jgi:hypothetical protein